MNQIEKYLAIAAGKEKVHAGDDITVNVDLAIAHDITGPMAVEQFKKIGVGHVFDAQKVVFVLNAINIGLLVLVCDMKQQIENGQEIEVDLVSAEVTIWASGGKISGTILASNVLETLEAGGLIAKVRKQLKIS